MAYGAIFESDVIAPELKFTSNSPGWVGAVLQAAPLALPDPPPVQKQHHQRERPQLVHLLHPDRLAREVGLLTTTDTLPFADSVTHSCLLEFRVQEETASIQRPQCQLILQQRNRIQKKSEVKFFLFLES